MWMAAEIPVRPPPRIITFGVSLIMLGGKNSL
jgi:hypothetical protein